MNKRIFTALTMLLVSVTGLMAQSGHFLFDPQAYQDEHVIDVTLADNEDNVYTREFYNDATYYLGAFIGDECRGEAELQFTGDAGTILAAPIFSLRVHGNADTDNGKTITFRLYKFSMATQELSTAEYYIPSTTASFAFQKEGRTGEPSKPYRMKFVPATSIQLPEMVVPIGETVNLMEQITTMPEGSLLPYPISWNQPEDGSYEISTDGILTAKKVILSAPVNLQAGTGIFSLGGNGTITIINPAVSFEWTDRRIVVDEVDPTKGTITVSVNDAGALDGILDGGGYALKGIDANNPSTTTFSWTSSDMSVVGASPTSAAMIVMGLGTAVLTGAALDGVTITPKLTVKVIQPVTNFTFGDEKKDEGVLVVQVGDDIKARLAEMVHVEPTEATDKTYTIQFDKEYFDEQDGKIIAMKSNSDGMGTITLTEEMKIIGLEPNDGFRSGNPELVTVVIIPTQPKAIGAKEATLFMVTPDNPPVDISTELYGNLTITPETMKISDYPVIMNSNNIEVIEEYGEDNQGRTLFRLKKSGEATMTANLTVLDNLKAQVNESMTAAPTVIIPTTQLETSFKVEIHDGLSEFTLDNISTTAGGTVEITLTPQPAGVEYDPEKISLTVTPAVDMPKGWTFADVAPVEGDKTGLRWTITTKSVGDATITVNYVKNDAPTQMGQGMLNVAQLLTVKDGWQWISICQGGMDDKDAIEMVFGQNLKEIRSSEALIYNDVKYGYFGQLNQIETLKTYKLCMKDLGDACGYWIVDSNPVSKYFANNNNMSPTGGSTGALSIQTRKGWNWIGNPYQYTQKLTDIFGNTIFSEGDIIKGKTAFATYTNGSWAGELQALTPGEGYLFYVANAGQIDFVREFSLSQQSAAAAPAMNRAQQQSPWTIDDSRFADNMSMIAHVGGLADDTRLTLYAFVGNECRGRGVAVGDRQFITIHGEQGERITFRAYDETTGQYYDIQGSRAFAVVSGTMEAPVALYAGEVTSIDAIGNTDIRSSAIYDLQGRRVNAPKKGIYVQGGKKVVR